MKLARVNVVSMRETPEDFVLAWDFFRSYYLSPDPDNDFDPGFYLDKVASGAFHRSLAEAWAKYPRNIILAPRGSAKSTVVGTEFPLMNLVVGRHYPTTIILSKDEFAEKRVNKIRGQLERNTRIRDDFGDLKPAKGSGLYNLHTLTLTNGAELQALSIMGAGRGERSKFMVFDDVETDPKGGADSERQLSELMAERFQSIYLPMVREGSSMFFIGTGHRKSTFIYRACTTVEDPAFSDVLWHRKNYAAARLVNGEILEDSLVWREGLSKNFLTTQRKLMGSKFAGEYLGAPESDGDRILRLSEFVDYGPAQQGDDASGISVDPLNCMTKMSWWETPRGSGAPVLRESEARTLFEGLHRFITVDYAPTQGPDSDWSAVHVMGLDAHNQLWSLDLCLVREREAPLIDRIIAMARKWRVRVVGVEAVSLQIAFMNQVADRAREIANAGHWAPRVVPIKYRAKVSKEDRISGLEFRFNRGLVKLPRWRASEVVRGPGLHPKPYERLLFEIENFTPDGKGLDKDDALDTLAMSSEIIGGSQPKPIPAPVPSTGADLLRAGRIIDELGIPAVLACSPSEIPVDVIRREVHAFTLREKANNVQWDTAAL